MKKLLNILYLTTFFASGLIEAMEQGNVCAPLPGKPAQGKLLFIETGNNPSYAFESFLSMAAELGQHPTFKQGHEVDPKTLDEYGTILINIDPNLFSALLRAHKEAPAKPHPYVAVTENLLKEIARLSHKNIIFSLPSAAITARTPDSKAVVEQLLKQSNTAPAEKVAAIFADYLTHFNEHDARRKYLYETTLFATEAKKLSPEFEAAQKKLQEIPATADVALLPTSVSSNPKAAVLAPLWPHGIMWHTEENQNNILLTRDSHLSFADIGENFFVQPLERPQRHQLIAVVYKMLQEFLVDSNAPTTKVPLFLSSKGEKLAKLDLFAKRAMRTYSPAHQWLKREPLSCAWMDVRSYYGKPAESVDYLLNSGINVLWLDLIPEAYISVNARMGADKELFYKQVEEFTRHLKERAEALNKPLPRLFMGTDITINFRTDIPATQKLAKVETPAVSLYGKTLTKVPSPLDIKDLWQTQVIDVIDTFVTEWENKIGNGLPLAGVFFDFEMYQAQDQASSYDGNVDFSDLAWQTFLSTYPQPNLPELATLNERVQYLIDTKQMQNYFDALTEQAKEIGQLVHDKIKARLPNAMIGAYAANMPAYWWYLGFMSKLSSPGEPLIFGTFNTNFYSHADWLEKHKVYMHHMQVQMLSKLRKPEDFKQIDTILENHDGIWFNRFSRLIQDDVKHEENIESSPLDKGVVAEEIHKHLYPTKTNEPNEVKE